MSFALPILSVLEWDPTVRGLLIIIAAIVILPGSVFLLLSTNVGARLGFLLALTGFFGWMTVQGLVWWVFAQGNKGRQPAWEAHEIITGPIAEGTTEEAVLETEFPRGWEKLEAGDRILGDAQAAADAVLAPTADAGGQGAEGGGDAEEARHFESPFEAPTDYVPVSAYRKGGETWFFTLLHKPHYTVVQVQGALEQPPTADGAPPVPKPDITKPVTSVVMVRDLGNVRLPPFMLMVSSGVIFGVLLSILHRRDKEAMAARAPGSTAVVPAT